MQAYQFAAERFGEHLGDFGLADAGFALKHQRSLHLERQEHRGRKTALGNVVGASQQGKGVVDGFGKCDVGHRRNYASKRLRPKALRRGRTAVYDRLIA